MKKLRQALEDARAHKTAIGHFNFSDIAGFRAIFEAARDLNLPVMFGVSEGERDFVGMRSAAGLIRGLREEFGLPVYLNADHTHSFEKIEAAARAGCDEVIFDASKVSLEENIRMTKEAVEIVKSINPDIIVEGEIGFIGSASAILEKVPDDAAVTADALTKAEEARQFVAETKVDVLAPAVGNMHGMLQSMVSGTEHKQLNIERIAAIAAATPAYLTLHGGSGTADEGFADAIKAGITIIHVSTELRVAWRRGVEAGLAADLNEVAPYKILLPAVEQIKAVVKDRLKLFSGLG